jgi:hypothetical protein
VPSRTVAETGKQTQLVQRMVTAQPAVPTDVAMLTIY